MLGLETYILRGATPAYGSALIKSCYQSIQVQIETSYNRIRSVPARLNERIITPIVTTIETTFNNAPIEQFSIGANLSALPVLSIESLFDAFGTLAAVPLLALVLTGVALDAPVVLDTLNIDHRLIEKSPLTTFLVLAGLSVVPPTVFNFPYPIGVVKRDINLYVETISHIIDLIWHPEYRSDMGGFNRAMERQRHYLAADYIIRPESAVHHYPFLQSCKQNNWALYRCALSDTPELIITNRTIMPIRVTTAQNPEIRNQRPPHVAIPLTDMIVRELRPGESLIHYAARTNDLALAEILLGEGTRKPISDALRHVVPAHNRDARIAFLLDPDARTADGETPLKLAIQQGNRSMVYQLLNFGVEVDGSDIRELLDRFTPEDLNTPIGDRGTLLHVAAHAKSTYWIRELRKRGADTFIKNKAGQTPLQYAREHLKPNTGRPEYIRALQDVSLRDRCLNALGFPPGTSDLKVTDKLRLGPENDPMLRRIEATLPRRAT